MKRLCAILLVFMLMVSMPALAEKPDRSYEDALNLLAEASYAQAAEKFAALGSYADAPRYAMYASALEAAEDGLYASAVQNFLSLDSFLDSSLLAAYYTALGYEAAELYEAAAELLTEISLYRDGEERLAGYPARIQERDYRNADAAEAEGRLEDALEGFLALGYYSDSPQRAETVQQKINERDYAAADALEQAGDYTAAYELFIALNGYSDSADRAAALLEKINEQEYMAADLLEQQGSYAEAYERFTALDGYKDSADRAASLKQKALYQQGMSAIADGSYAKAREAFTQLGDYEDSEAKLYALGVGNFAQMKQLDESTASFEFHDAWGLLNFETNKVTAPQWSSVSRRAQNCIAVGLADNYGLVDADGNELSPIQWYSISGMENGLMVAAVRSKEGYDYIYRFTLLNAEGKPVSDAYKAIGENISKDTGYLSLHPVSFPGGLVRAQNADGLWGYLNPDGSVAIEFAYKDAQEFSNGRAAVKQGGKWGYIDAQGLMVIQPLFSEAGPFKANGQAEVHSANGWHVIDDAGELVYFMGQELPVPAAPGAADPVDVLVDVWVECFGSESTRSDFIEEIEWWFEDGYSEAEIAKAYGILDEFEAALAAAPAAAAAPTAESLLYDAIKADMGEETANAMWEEIMLEVEAGTPIEYIAIEFGYDIDFSAAS